MLDDGGLLTGRCPHRPPLAALLRVGPRILVGPLGEGQALEAHREPGVVHHREHVAHSLVLLADQVADRPLAGVAVGHDAGGARLDAHLVLDGHAAHVVGLTRAAVVTHQELGHDEAGDALGARRGVGGAGQHQVHDVVGHVVVTEGDEDLLARDAVAAVGSGHRLGGQRTHIRTGLGLGEVHGGRPLAGDHAGQVDLLQLLAAVVQQQVDGALGEQWAHRERHVRRGEHLLEREPDQPREPTSSVGRREGHARPSRLHVPAVGVDEAIRGGHRTCGGVVGRSRHITGQVQRRHDVLHQPGALGHDSFEGGGVQLGESLELAQLVQVDQVVEHEVDVFEGGLVVAHRRRG